MKKILLLLLASLLIFASCDLLEEEDEKTYSAPDVGTAADLEASGASAAPADEDEAIEIMQDSINALLSMNPDMSSSVRATETESETLDWSDSVGGGTVDMTGTMSGTFTMPDGMDDGTWEPELNTTYNDLIAYGLDVVLSGTVDGVTTDNSDEGYTYVLDGQLKMDMSVDMNIDLIVGSETMDVNYDVFSGLSYGLAFAVKRNDDVGGKFILTYGASFSITDGDADDMESAMEVDMYADQTPATLKIYDDNDVLQAEYDVEPEFCNAFFMGDDD